jgi:hypothetical protein
MHPLLTIEDRLLWVTLTGRELLENYGAHLATYRTARCMFEVVLEASYMTRQLELVREGTIEQAELQIQRKEAQAEFEAALDNYRLRRRYYVMSAIRERRQEFRNQWYRDFFPRSHVIREMKELRDHARRMFTGLESKPKRRVVRPRPRQVGAAQALALQRLKEYRWSNGEDSLSGFPPYNGGVHQSTLPPALSDELEELFLTAAKEPDRTLSMHVSVWEGVSEILPLAMRYHAWINDTLPLIPPTILLVVQDPAYTEVHDLDRRIIERFFAEEPKDTRREIGFIAQEVRSVAPEFVDHCHYGYPHLGIRRGNSHKAG